MKTMSIFSLCLLFLPNDALVQESIYGIAFERVMSTGSIACILQDQTGFIWLGEESGLYKYDGHRLSAYRHEPSDPYSLSDNWITAICEQDSFHLWVGTYRGGLCRFDKKNSQFKHFLLDPGDPNSLLNNRIFSLCLTRDRTLWIGTPGGICYQDLTSIEKSADGGFHYLPLPGIHSDLTLCIYEDTSGMLWFGTISHGLFALDRQSGEWRNYHHDPGDPQSISSDIVSTIYQDRNGNLWLGTGNWFYGPGGGLNKFDRRQQRFEHFQNDPGNPNSLSNNRVLAIAETKKGINSHLWIGTYGGGLDYFDPASNKFYHFRHDPTDPRTINNDLIQSLLLDENGVLWIGSKGQGLAKYSAFASKFHIVAHHPGNLNSLSHDIVMSFCQDQQGDLWIGTYGGGLNRWQRRSNSFEHFQRNPLDANSLSNDFILCLLADADNPDILWIGTDGGLNRLNIRTRQFHHYLHDPANPNSISDNGVLCLFQDRQHEFWLGTRVGGLNRLDIRTGLFHHYPSNAADSFSVSDFTIIDITEDRQGNLWIGTFSAGLNKLDRKSGTFTHYRYQADDPTSLSFNSIECIVEDDDGNLWIATSGGGLNCFDPSTGLFTTYTEADGLASNIIWGIERADDGRLWLSTMNGLCQFDPLTRQAKNFTVHDGLQSQMFTPFSHYHNEKGELFFGGVNGFNYFHPDSIRYNLQKPEIAITRLLVHSASKRSKEDKVLSPKSHPLLATGSKSESITLSHQENYFTLEFTALDYHASLKNQFAYFLQGFDHSWTFCGNRHEANYTQVTPGRYIFRVKGSSNDGVWNEEGASVRIIIRPPWWRAGWAYVLYALFLGAIAVGLWRLQVRRIKVRHELSMRTFETRKLQEIDSMKSRFFANISHEFRTPLTLILGPLSAMLAQTRGKEKKEQLKLMQRNARRLLQLINQLLDLSRIEAGKMKLLIRRENIVPLLNRFVQSFESQAKLKGIELKFRSEREEILAFIDRDKIEKIFYNLLANALKFTQAGGTVDCHIELVNHQSEIAIAVTDTGIGIPADRLDKIFDRFYQVDDSRTREHEGTGIGLALTKELVDLHHGRIEVQSEPEKGTTFIVFLPLGKEHFKLEEIVADRPLEDIKQEIPQLEPGLADGVEPSAGLPGRSRRKAVPIVLIVEDNRDMRAYMQECLAGDYRVIEAIDGEDGLQRAIDEIPDLIISDVMMPKMDGFQLCGRLKSDERTSHIPVILLTARAAAESKMKGLKLGADDYLIKPFEANELRIRVKNLIESRRALRQRFSRTVLLQPDDIAVTPADLQFLQRLLAIIEGHMGDEDFSVATLVKRVGLSRMQLHRKLHALTDHSTTDFIRRIRLQRAAVLLRQDFGGVAEIAYKVGFKSLSNFTASFRKQFGQLPSEYAAKFH